MKRYPNATNELLKAISKRGYNAKFTFDSEDDAKRFFEKVKADFDKLPEFLKPKK